jgi:predicted NACHT family NTPase
MLEFIAGSVFGKLAGGLLGLWLKDKEYLSLLSDVAIAKAQEHAADAISKRKFSRFIHQIEDEIGSALAAHLEAEFRSLRTGDKTLLLEKAIDTIRTEEFYQRCFEEAFDQDRILESYKEEISAYASEVRIADVNAAQTIFGYCIAKFLSVLTTLPTFNEDSLRALLKDTDEILDRIQNLEIEVKTLTTKKKKEIEEDEKHFRKLTSRRLRKIDVFGVDSRELPKRYDLSIAYLNLTLSSLGDDGELGTQRVLSTAFTPSSRLVIVKGDPGSGKTTLLSYLALNIAEQ